MERSNKPKFRMPNAVRKTHDIIKLNASIIKESVRHPFSTSLISRDGKVLKRT